MKADNNRIIMLGTGHAAVTRCYNTCFIIRTSEGMLLVDAGGGNGILTQLERANIPLGDIHNMFVTHAHTDHVLGAVWMVRMALHRAKDSGHDGTFTVFGHDKVLDTIERICRMTMSESELAYMGKKVLLHELKDEDQFSVCGMEMQCFDIHSTKEKQFGFRAVMPGGKTVVCLGDEPYHEVNRRYVENADWLMSEAFCLYRDRDIFHPYEKHHSTAMEAGAAAAKLHVKNLLLYHTEDSDLSHRKHDYTEECARSFSGNIIVPDDLESIDI